MAGLDDKHFVVGEHLSESVGEDFAHVDVDLMHLELLLVTLGPPVSTAAGIISHLQLRGTNAREKENKTRTRFGRLYWPNFFGRANNNRGSFVTFSKLTPVLLTSAWSLAIVSFSLSR